MSKTLLRVSDLHAYYGESHILHGVDFEVKEGELITLLGRNGAGRSTTLKAILGLTGKRSGSIRSKEPRPLICPPTKLPAWDWAIARKSAVFFQA